jgi:HK97 gp10 family phage protein
MTTLSDQLNALSGLKVYAGTVSEKVAEIAAGLAPVRCGELSLSIHAEEEMVVADAEHAPYVEFGTRNMAAQPYLRPAIDEHQREIEQVAAEAVEAAIEETIA